MFVIYNQSITKTLNKYVVFSFTILQLLVPLSSRAASENLDEIVARSARMASATWGPNYVEDANNHYKWQPETLMYTDVNTGHEVWRMTSTKDEDNFYHNDISWAQWSANGKWLAFASTRDTNAYRKTSNITWFIVQTNGADLMPVIDGANREYSSAHEYFHWSPQIPDVYYETGGNQDGLRLNGYDLYKNTVSNTGVTRQLLFTTNRGNGNTKPKKLSKTISGDGKKILLRDSYVPSGPHYLYPCTVYPENAAGCDWDGYSIDRGQGPGYDTMSDSYTREHGGALFLSGNEANGYYTYIMPSGTSAWWRMSLTGSAPDGGPLYTNGGVSGEVMIMSTKLPNNPPWPESHYWSHVSPDWWGTKVVFSNMEDDNRPGIAHQDAVTHEYDSRSFLNDYGVQHNDWHGFTDYTVSSYTPNSRPDGLGQRITSQRYNDATLTDIQTVCFAHTREKGGSAYSTLPRPFISPDGTKVAWSSEFLNGSANRNDIYWCVIQNPKPPTSLNVSKNGDSVRLTWQRPSYTTRGWPNEKTDVPPTSKEIKGYHVWVSDNGNTGWSEVTSGAISTEYIDLNQANGTTKYYAVTSEEYSRLESRKLSEVIEVINNSKGTIKTKISSPSGKMNYWTSPPKAPIKFTAKKTGVAGQYSLKWLSPDDKKIRYFNVYYATRGNPEISQRTRIASLPVGTIEYLDWNADKEKNGFYMITSVDRQGNESRAIGTDKQVP
jgi:hypothetical protein